MSTATSHVEGVDAQLNKGKYSSVCTTLVSIPYTIFEIEFHWTSTLGKGPVTQVTRTKTRTIKMHPLDWLNERGRIMRGAFNQLRPCILIVLVFVIRQCFSQTSKAWMNRMLISFEKPLGEPDYLKIIIFQTELMTLTPA